MKYIFVCLLAIISAALFTLCDTLSKIWAQGDPMSKWFIYLVIISPFAYFLFGYVTRTYGLTLTSNIINILIVLFTPIIGLFYYKEWHMVTPIGYLGMAFAFIGLVLIIFFGVRTEMR